MHVKRVSSAPCRHRGMHWLHGAADHVLQLFNTQFLPKIYLRLQKTTAALSTAQYCYRHRYQHSLPLHKHANAGAVHSILPPGPNHSPVPIRLPIGKPTTLSQRVLHKPPHTSAPFQPTVAQAEILPLALISQNNRAPQRPIFRRQASEQPRSSASCIPPTSINQWSLHATS